MHKNNQYRSKLVSLFSLVVMLGLMPTLVFAAEEEGYHSSKEGTVRMPMFEVWTGSLLDFTLSNSGAPGANTASTLNVFTAPTTVRPAFGYIIGDTGLEIKVTPAYMLTSTGGTNSISAGSFLLLGGVNYSFLGDTIKNSFFVEVQFGANRLSNGVTAASTNFAWAAGVGKRFQLTESITWNPQFEVTGIGSSTIGYSNAMYYSFIPVQFGLFF